MSLGLIAAATLGPASCVPAPDEPEPCPQTSTDIRRYILIPRCGGCHGTEDPAAGLNLVQAGIEQRVVNVDADACQGKLVVPGRPDDSLLIRKLGRDPLCGEIMPRSGDPLSEHEVSCLRTWVESLQAPEADAGIEDAHDAEAPGDAGVDAPEGGHPGLVCPVGQMACGSRCINAIEPRFGALHSRIFVASCTFDACHSGDRPKEGLNALDADTFYGTTVDAPSLQRPELMRIEPAHPERSYLVNKLRGIDMAAMDSTGSQESVRMPPEQPLCEEKIELIEQWISAGAPKD